ncbi:MAG: YHS domain-containing protein [Candidatus Binatia bacterium]
MHGGEVEIVFIIADLCGYSALTEAHGSLGAATAAMRYAEIAHSVLQPGTRFVERVGDEVLIAAEDASAAVRTALALRQAVEREPLFPTLRTGLHAGSVVEQAGSYFGSALNITARVAAHARGGQILCTDRVRTSASSCGSIAYEALGPVTFKNIVNPALLFEVVSSRHSAESAVLDPVCRMQVRPGTAPARLPYAGATYHFCSFDCAKTFAEHPDRYVPSPAA